MLKIKTIIIGVNIAILCASVGSAFAMKRNDPNRPVDKISADLGVTEQQFVDCFYHVNPAPKGVKASGARERANKAILLPCLQKANGNITNSKLDSVMDKYRPEGRVAGH